MEERNTTQQDSTRKLSISTMEALAEGYSCPEPVPVPVKCKFCGRTLDYYGICNPLTPKHVIVWRDRPERCSCQQAQDFWKRQDAAEAERKAAEEAEKARQEEMRRFAELIERSGMGARFQRRRFDTYQRTTSGQQRAWEQAKRYADNFERMRPKKDSLGNMQPPEIERNGLFIAGSYGTGKTHLAAAIVNQLLDNGTACICMTMIDLLERIKVSDE